LTAKKKKLKETTIVQKHQKNFNALSKAFANNDVCLMDCIERATGEHVAVICAMHREEDGQIAMTPFAKFFNGNPYEMLISPLEYDESVKQKEGKDDVNKIGDSA